MKTDLFQSCGHCWVFQICWHIECSTFKASFFRIWSSSTGIPSPPLALFVVMLPKAHLTSHSRMYGYRWVITPSWLSGSWRFFFCIVLCILATSFFFFHLFLLVGGWLLNNIVVVFAIHWHESAMDLHVFPILILPSHLPPHLIPLSHLSAPAPSTCLIHLTWSGDLFHTW